MLKWRMTGCAYLGGWTHFGSIYYLLPCLLHHIPDMESVERCHCHCLRNHLADRSHCFVFLLEHESSQGLCEERLPFQSFWSYMIMTCKQLNDLALVIWSCRFGHQKSSNTHGDGTSAWKTQREKQDAQLWFPNASLDHRSRLFWHLYNFRFTDRQGFKVTTPHPYYSSIKQHQYPCHPWSSCTSNPIQTKPSRGPNPGGTSVLRPKSSLSWMSLDPFVRPWRWWYWPSEKPFHVWSAKPYPKIHVTIRRMTWVS